MHPLEFVLGLVAMVLVAITIWILLLRKHRSSESGVRVEPADEYDLQELATMAESLKQRIDILESILDAEVPDWRDQNEARHD